MSDIGNDIVGLLKHPVVAPGDGVVWVDGFNPLREHGIGVIVILCLPAGHIRQYNRVVDLRTLLLDRLQRTIHRRKSETSQDILRKDEKV